MKKVVVKTKLDELYSLREHFSIVGLTGRTGSGCSEIADELCKDFEGLNHVEKPLIEPTTVQERKYEIVYKFNEINWITYRQVKYKHLLLYFILKLPKDRIYAFLSAYFKLSGRHSSDSGKVAIVFREINRIKEGSPELDSNFLVYKNVVKIAATHRLKAFAEFYWDVFTPMADEVDKVLKENGVIERVYLLHHAASNLREHGSVVKRKTKQFDENIYHIAKVINRLVKGTRLMSDGVCHVVIDSLRNSSEINYFRERYSGFYFVAAKSYERRSRLLAEYNGNADIVDALLKIDDTEYKCNDFVKGHFFAPDVQNCIQKADFHVISRSAPDGKRDFISTSQQLLRFQALIQQPGMITPSAIERCMQAAFNAKLSSGCISRQVGAVVTDREFSIKAVGWNDVPRGAVPCSVRNVKDLKGSSPFGFSLFERGMQSPKGTPSESNPDEAEMESESQRFNEFVKSNYNESVLRQEDLGGINCPYCFKTAYNKFKGDSNQVHTRSLHAEENAMLQISKYGGQPLKGGYLFTTASPCELCSKKAYQLGITDIFYIDPYPGISRSHILKQSSSLDGNPGSDPNLHMFSGAIGRGYLRLYEPFMAQKDEISILTGLKVETPVGVRLTKWKELMKDKLDPKLKSRIDELFDSGELTIDTLEEMLRSGLEKLL